MAYIYGTAGNDDYILIGNPGDVVLGLAGDDNAVGTNAWLYGGDGNDKVTGLGSSFVYGGDGNDFLSGSYAYGGLGADTMIGTIGGDTLIGEDGADLIYASSGADWVYAGSGNDAVFGGADSDVVQGNDGDDILHGGGGVDYLWGGAGRDTFSAGADAGALVVQDFHSGEDFIAMMPREGLMSFAQVQGAMTYYEGIGTIITLGPDQNVWVMGVAPDAIHASDILFMVF